MKISVPKERRDHETRVALSPEIVKKLVAQGHTVCVEKGAGFKASMPDHAYADAGATLVGGYDATVKDADLVIKVQPPLSPQNKLYDEISPLPEGCTILGILAPYVHENLFHAYAEKKLTCFSLDLAPRITRAQSMDVLSSQSNLGGYRAVIEAAEAFNRAFPLMMTAAGTVPPARVLILGAGVAGLQAIATAKRLGAIVSAFDVRETAKEQVESLGARFISVEAEEQAEDQSGYAKEMSQSYKTRQSDRIREALEQHDIVISTALIPGLPAPVLISREMLDIMKPGSIIVDMAVEAGGNCEASKLGKVVETPHGVKVIGYPNLPSRVPKDASALYARNILSFLEAALNDTKTDFELESDDAIIKATLLTKRGDIVHENFRAKMLGQNDQKGDPK